MDFFKRPVFRNVRVIFIVWAGLAVIAGLSKYMQGNGAYGNYLTYTNISVQLAHQSPIYVSEHVLYGPAFGVLMLPFAFLPDWLGITLWLGVLATLLFWAVGKLPLAAGLKAAVYWICLHEMMTAAFNMQFNIGIAAIIVLAFVFVEREKDIWAALVIVLGMLTKIYGIAGLAFFLFSKHKRRFALACAGWTVVWLALPLLFVSPEYLSGQYVDWIHQLIAKNAANNTHAGASIMQNISFIGMLQRIFHLEASSTLPILAGGIALFLLPLIRIRQYASQTFRMLFMASVLLFVVLFSTGSESSTYIIAFVGVAVWFALQPRPYRVWPVFLLVLALALSSLSPTDLFPRHIRETWIIPYALKALPCALVWLTLTVQLWRMENGEWRVENGLAPQETFSILHSPFSIDLILPCYNPPRDWPETVSLYFGRLQTLLAGVDLRLIIANDGSERHVGREEQERLLRYIPGARITGYEKNRGKGYALRHAVRQSDAPCIIYTDYDFPFEPESIKSVANALLNHADVVVGNRGNSYYEQLPGKRKIISKVSRYFNKYLLHIPACDTQGGLKGFNRKGREIFLQTKIEEFLFDTEFIFKACLRKDIRLQVVPIQTREGVIFSNMGTKTLWKEMKNFLRILFRCV